MLPDLKARLYDYVAAFNTDDDEFFSQCIDNAAAYDYLSQNIPLLDCPDKDLERIYYFRWWTLRKHWKETPVGHFLTEFFPAVNWAGPYNSINCAVGHHLREARWLRDEDGWLWELIDFWLDGHGNALSYSSWLADAVETVFALRPDAERMKACLPKLDALYREREEMQLRPCGLYWSKDGRDGMEFSISGSGIRPTINSYMCANARAIARMAAAVGMEDMAEAYTRRADALAERIEALLWDGDFYRTIPCEKDDPADWQQRPEVPDDNRVRELVGYIPWYFRLAKAEHDAAFAHLLDPQGFYASHGLTTAEQRHPRFLFTHSHECLWNGYVWPYATSQTLTAAANLIRDRKESAPLKVDDFYALLLQYARSHRIEDEDGKVHCWIDEDMHPYTGRWYARDELKADNWNSKRGGYERGKDYNHSTFCDLVLDGLLGIHFEGDALCADPILPASWDYFLVTGLTQDNYTVLYDRDGSHYGCGKGLHIFKA